MFALLLRLMRFLLESNQESQSKTNHPSDLNTAPGTEFKGVILMCIQHWQIYGQSDVWEQTY